MRTALLRRRWLPLPLLALSLSAARADTLLPPVAAADAARPLLLSKSFPQAPRSEQTQDTTPEPPRDALRLQLHKSAGLELSRPLQVSDRELVLGVKGPLMKSNRVGLAFEVRF